MVIKLGYETDEDLPWDGMWEYILGGEDNQSTFSQRLIQESTQEESFASGAAFNFLLPDNAMELFRHEQEGRQKSLPPTPEEPTPVRSVETHARVQPSPRRQFWRRKRPNANQYNKGNFPPPADDDDNKGNFPQPADDDDEWMMSDALNDFFPATTKDESEVLPKTTNTPNKSKADKFGGRWGRRSVTPATVIDEDRSDIESIDMMLGPWNRSNSNGKDPRSSIGTRDIDSKFSVSQETSTAEVPTRGRKKKLDKRSSWRRNAKHTSSVSPSLSSAATAKASSKGSLALQSRGARPNGTERKKDAKNPGFNLLQEFASSLDPWIYDSSSYGSDSSGDGSSSSPSVAFQEEESLTTTSDASTNASSVEVPTKNWDSVTQKVDEVHLTFHAESKESLPPIEEDTKMKTSEEHRNITTTKDEHLDRHDKESAPSKRCALSSIIPRSFSKDENPVGIPSNDQIKSLDEAERTSSGVASDRSALDMDSASLSGSWKLSNTEDEHSRAERGGMGVSKMCCVIGKFPNERMTRGKMSSLPTHELTAVELARIFPKLRMVSDSKDSERKSEVVGNASAFDGNVPAHLQLPTEAISAKQGLQLLFEYEYEKGRHMEITYSSFGDNPREILQLQTHRNPPKITGKGTDSKKILLQVEASTVSLTDCRLRQGGKIDGEEVSLPCAPGVDVIGKIYRIDNALKKKCSLRVGDRVISLTTSGGNSRYVRVDPEALVKVPNSIDPAEAVCLTETYLSAFQLLHFGQHQSSRYKKASLSSKTVLVIGIMSPSMARAIGELSKVGGACFVYATAKQRHFTRLSEMGIFPLSMDPSTWSSNLEGVVDLIISFEGVLTPLHYKLLKENGVIVRWSGVQRGTFPPPPSFDSSFSKSPRMCSKLQAHARARLQDYNLFREWNNDMERSKRDLAHLVDLFHKEAIHPDVLDRIPLNKVSRAHEVIEAKGQLEGFLVCEPWLVSKSRAVSL